MPPDSALLCAAMLEKGFDIRGGIWFCAVSEGSRRSAGKPKWWRPDHGQMTLDHGKKGIFTTAFLSSVKDRYELYGFNAN